MFTIARLIILNWENTKANYATLLRLLIGMLALSGYWLGWNLWLVLALCLISGTLDTADGFLARTYGISVAGTLLDPFTDKILGWGAAITIAYHYSYSAQADKIGLFLIACIPSVVLLAFYDHMTIKMRSTDKKMKTNPTAQTKQFVLFSGLGCFFAAMAFLDYARKNTEDWRPQMFYVLLTILGVLLILEATRLTIKSARAYLANTKDPRAHEWARNPLVRVLLRIV